MEVRCLDAGLVVGFGYSLVIRKDLYYGLRMFIRRNLVD